MDTLTLWTYQPDRTYAAPVTKAFANWGIADNWDAVIGGQGAGLGAEGVTLTFPGLAMVANQFTFRSRVQIVIDGKIFFSGYVSEDARTKTGSSDEATLRISGPWWFLENCVYQFAQQYLQSLDANNNPTFGSAFYTHFTLNLLPVPQLSSGNLIAPYFIYLTVPQLFKSRAMIALILDFAKSQGWWGDYDAADILDVSVNPRDVLNIHCADAILAQIENYDAVIWFDYSQTPPKFHCKQRKDLPSISRAMVLPGSAFDPAKNIEGFKLRRRYDLACPYVQISYEQPYNVGGVNTIIQAFDIYPPPAGWVPGTTPPAPVDSLKAIITTVPLRAISGTTHHKFIKTQFIDLLNTDFWKVLKPEIDPNKNINATLEFDGLTLSNAQRFSNLPNIIIDGGYVPAMGGDVGPDDLLVQAAYHRKQSNVLAGTKIPAHTWRKGCKVTNLNFPNGVDFVWKTYSSDGDDIDNFDGMARDIYNDLNPVNGLWEGTVPLFEIVYSGQIVLGQNLNLQNTLAEHAGMAALIQRITVRRRSGGIFYSIEVGPNKTISAQQIGDRLRAARYRYITIFNFGNSPQGAESQHTRYQAEDALSESEPAMSEINLYEDSPA